MKRLLSVLLAALLVAMLLVPAAATAKSANANSKGHASEAPGQVKTSDSGAAKSGKKDSADEVGSFEGDSDEAETDDAGAGAGAGNGKALGKTKEKHVRSREASGAAYSDDESGTVEPKRTGIENALDHIMANIAKANAKVEDGTKKHVPPGLLRVMDKFISWLGLTPEPTEPAPDGADDMSDETSATPDPGSGEESSTVIPVEGEEAAVTP